jgi:hypothetical protein
MNNMMYLLYRACSSWIPLWGPVLSLLYLSRTPAQPQRKPATSTHYLQSPLIGNMEEGYLYPDSDMSQGDYMTSISRSAHQARILAQQHGMHSPTDHDHDEALSDSYYRDDHDRESVASSSTSNLTTPTEEESVGAGPYRETVHSTTSTNTLPSALHFPALQAGHHYDFSYRGGEEEHNGQYR